eukprot:COSAG02_NODE_61293_length_269_cov_0.600000_1_plen_43_part_10
MLSVTLASTGWNMCLYFVGQLVAALQIFPLACSDPSFSNTIGP